MLKKRLLFIEETLFFDQLEAAPCSLANPPSYQEVSTIFYRENRSDFGRVIRKCEIFFEEIVKGCHIWIDLIDVKLCSWFFGFVFLFYFVRL